MGGTGFVGGHLATALVNAAHTVHVLTRHRARHRALLVLPRVRLSEADVHDLRQLKAHFKACDAVINLIGILNERGHSGQGFQHAHVELARKVLEACQETGVPRLLHMSALNADAADGPSHYSRTKGAAEDLVLAQSGKGIEVTSFRPSVIFGPGDSFLNRFAALLGFAPGVFPLACANARFAPVYVGDVVAALVRALDNESTHGQRIELCGPHEYTLKQLVSYTAKLTGRHRWIIGLPDSLSRLQATILEYMPGKPFSLDNYRSLSVDSLCTQRARCPTSLESIAPAYLGKRNPQARLHRMRTAYWTRR